MTILLVFTLTSHLNAQVDNEYKKLADSLSEGITDKPVNISIGNFVFGDTNQMSAYSSLLRSELQVALSQTGKFKIIERKNLADLQKEKGFQSMDIFDPGAEVKNVSIKSISGIIRGRFYYRPESSKVKVYAELVWMEGAEKKSAMVDIPAEKIVSKILPDRQAGTTVKSLLPENFEKSSENIANIKKKVKKIPHNFKISLVTGDFKRNFMQGENLDLKIKSAKACNIAVFCYQSDGSVILLFPNPWSRNTFIPADKIIHIPGTVKHGFEMVVSPPYGTDVIQVVACTKKSALHETISKMVKDAPEKAGYRSLERGFVSKRLDDSLTEFENNNIKPEWSEKHIILSTYPKY